LAAASEASTDADGANLSKVGSSDLSNGDKSKGDIDGEADPQLRIKRSMNFGSVFGANSVGKGF